MPAHPPDDITDGREYTLRRALTRTFEEFCGEVESEYPERERKFLEITDRVVQPLRERVALTRFEIATVGLTFDESVEVVRSVTFRVGDEHSAMPRADETVTDTLAHVVAVLKETQSEHKLPNLDALVASAIQSGGTLVEILRLRAAPESAALGEITNG